jgi:signal transduction histidine kinase
VIAQQERGRLRADLALRESESRLYQILEVLPVGVFVADAQGHPFYANRRSQDLLGQGVMPDAPLEKLSEIYHTYVAGTDRIYPMAETPLARALAGEQAHADDIEIHRPGGSVRLEVWGAPVFGDDGRVKFGIAAFGDITDRERLRREREALNATLARNVVELESLNRELESFSYSVSHDLRAPLRAIDGFSRILLEDHAAQLSPEAGRLLGVVRERAQRMGRLIDDLLRFSQLSRQELELAEIDMTALVGSIVRDLQLDATHNGAEVVATPLPGARGDAGMLRQVWINFISNALKYSSRAPHPKVEIGGRDDGTERVYWVRDNGVGFDMAYVGRLFGVFQRLHRTEDFEGTGVGLAIVQRVVVRHGGRVWAEGKPDAGATFYFSLPARG